MNSTFAPVAFARLFRDEADSAAGRAAAAESGGRAFQHFDLLDGKGLAGADAGIADAVDIDVVTGIEAADEDPVAEGIAAFAGAERDARLGAEEVAERLGTKVVQRLVGDDGDGFRRVEQVLGEQAAGRTMAR